MRTEPGVAAVLSVGRTTGTRTATDRGADGLVAWRRVATGRDFGGDLALWRARNIRVCLCHQPVNDERRGLGSSACEVGNAIEVNTTAINATRLVVHFALVLPVSYTHLRAHET